MRIRGRGKKKPDNFSDVILNGYNSFISMNALADFSFFLERNMLTFFLNILDQNPGSYVCVQLLQTLNILFENIRNETSICKYLDLKLSTTVHAVCLILFGPRVDQSSENVVTAGFC